MAPGRQPRRARGTIEHPNSAIGLRIVLASFGLVVCILGAILLLHLGHSAFAYVLLAAAVVALVDLIVILRRR